MAVNLTTIIQSIRHKVAQLTARAESLSRQNAEQSVQIAELTAEIERLRAEIKSLKTDNDYLAVSHRLAQSPDEIIKSRRMIAGWIREIDRCISQLKE